MPRGSRTCCSTRFFVSIHTEKLRFDASGQSALKPLDPLSVKYSKNFLLSRANTWFPARQKQKAQRRSFNLLTNAMDYERTGALGDAGGDKVTTDLDFCTFPGWDPKKHTRSTCTTRANTQAQVHFSIWIKDPSPIFTLKLTTW